MDILELFPTPVGISTLKRDLTEEEIKIIEDLKKDIHTNYGGGNFITNNNKVLNIPELNDLKTVITRAINEYFTNVFKPSTNMELYITQSWLSITPNGSGHRVHSHGNSLLSCVFYIDIDDEDAIQFINERQHLGNICIYPRIDDISITAGSVQVNVVKNCMVIFPSTLEHSVPLRPDHSKGVRISLSCNTWFKGEVGSVKNLTQLECL